MKKIILMTIGLFLLNFSAYCQDELNNLLQEKYKIKHHQFIAKDLSILKKYNKIDQKDSIALGKYINQLTKQMGKTVTLKETLEYYHQTFKKSNEFQRFTKNYDKEELLSLTIYKPHTWTKDSLSFSMYFSSFELEQIYHKINKVYFSNQNYSYQSWIIHFNELEEEKLAKIEENRKVRQYLLEKRILGEMIRTPLPKIRGIAAFFSYEKAKEKAIKEGKNILLIHQTTSDNLFFDKDLQNLINTNFVCLLWRENTPIVFNNNSLKKNHCYLLDLKEKQVQKSLHIDDKEFPLKKILSK